MMYAVYKRDYDIRELMFAGDERECLIVYDTLTKYHHYDYSIDIEMEHLSPTYSSIEHFLDTPEYLGVYKEILK